MHSFKTRLEPADRIDRTENRWVVWFEQTAGSAMSLARREPVKIGKNQ